MSSLARKVHCCPYCWFRDMQPSRPRGLEWLLLIMGIRSYRCLLCQRSFWIWSDLVSSTLTSNALRTEKPRETTSDNVRPV